MPSEYHACHAPKEAYADVFQNFLVSHARVAKHNHRRYCAWLLHTACVTCQTYNAPRNSPQPSHTRASAAKVTSARREVTVAPESAAACNPRGATPGERSDARRRATAVAQDAPARAHRAASKEARGKTRRARAPTKEGSEKRPRTRQVRQEGPRVTSEVVQQEALQGEGYFEENYRRPRGKGSASKEQH